MVGCDGSDDDYEVGGCEIIDGEEAAMVVGCNNDDGDDDDVDRL